MPTGHPPLLAGRTAVVTGAARGIGRGIAACFLEQGANVVAGDLLEFAPDDPLRSSGAAFHALHCDVARDEDVAKLVQAAMQRFGRVDCLVSNAADVGPVATLEATDPAAFDRTVRVVLGSVFSGMRHVAPLMRQQGGGSIINIGSTSALRPTVTLHAYGAAKAAAQMLTQSAALELAPAGIRVNYLCPGAVATRMFGLAAGLSPEAAERSVERAARELAAVTPLGRAGTPEDVAQAALWLASDASSFVTGQVIAVDGGMTLGRPLPPGQTPAQFFGRVVGA